MKITKTNYEFKTRHFHGEIGLNGDRKITIWEDWDRFIGGHLNVREKEIDELITILREAKEFLAVE